MKGDIMIGAYPFLADGTCEWVAADFDGHHGNAFEHAKALADTFREYGIDPLCNTSQSGRGVHVRIIFDDPRGDLKPMEVWVARRFMEAFIEMCELPTLGEGGALDRIFPTQDTLPGGRSIGNQIAMPLNMEAANTRNGSMLLDQQFNTVPLGEPTWDMIELYDPVNRLDVVDALGEIGRLDVLEDSPAKRSRGGSFDGRESFQDSNASDLDMIIGGCEFIQYACESGLTYFEWIALAANLACYDPHGGRALFHKISACDKGRYNHETTEKKYENILRTMGGPITCERIASEGWRCPMLGEDGVCNKFRNDFGRGPRAPASIPRFVGNDVADHAA
jgi:hypothetical protein